MDTVPVSLRAITDEGLSTGELRTYTRLVARAWQRGGQSVFTAPLLLGEEQIMELLNCDRATYRRHFKTLERRHYIRINPAGGARHSITLLVDPHSGQAAVVIESQNCDNLLSPESQNCDSRPEGQKAAKFSESQNCDYVVVVESDTESESTKLLSQQQQQPAESQNCDKPPSRLDRLLISGGVWSSQVPGLVAQLAQHETALDAWYLETHVTTRDVLGWLMDLRDPAQKARRRNLGALLFTNLNQNNQAALEYRPPYVCRHCHVIAPRCVCGRLELDLPAEFDLLALAEQPAAGEGHRPSLFERWGICEICYAVPCQCPAIAEEESVALVSTAGDPRLAEWQTAAKNNTLDGRLWLAALGQLQLEIPKTTFDTWVRPTVLLAREGDAFVISVGNTYARDWLENRLAGTIVRTLAGLVDRPVTVRFVCLVDFPQEGALNA